LYPNAFIFPIILTSILRHIFIMLRRNDDREINRKGAGSPGSGTKNKKTK